MELGSEPWQLEAAAEGWEAPGVGEVPEASRDGRAVSPALPRASLLGPWTLQDRFPKATSHPQSVSAQNPCLFLKPSSTRRFISASEPRPPWGMKAAERGAVLIPAHLAGGPALKGTRLAGLPAPPVADWTRRLRFKCKIRAGGWGRRWPLLLL